MKKKILVGILALGLVVALFTGCSKAKTPAHSEVMVTPPVTSPAAPLPSGLLSAGTPPAGTPQSSLNPGPSSEAPAGFIQNVLALKVTEPSDAAVLNKDSVAVKGQTAPGATVSVNDEVGKADGNGNFSIIVNLDEGIDAIDVIAMNADGDAAEVLLLVTVDLADTASVPSPSGSLQALASTGPGSISLKIISPVDGADINGDVVTVKGQTAPGAVVNVNEETDIADDNGNFSIIVSLETGLNAIDVFATDEDGDQAEELILVNAG
jgi:hypothetical protein